MKLIRGLTNLKALTAPSVVTIGAFDGLHLGHQAVLEQLDTYPYQKVVILFEPQPKEYFSKQPAPRLSRLRDKLNFLAQQGVDIAVCIRFNADFANITAAQFIDDILIKKLNCKTLVVGDDFRFGHKRLGDFDLLQADKRFDVVPTQTFQIDNARVSSSRVRDAVLSGDFTQAEVLLGRAYSLSGKVAHGDKVGRQWGFPTLNIGLSKPMVVSGVYVVQVHGLAKAPLKGVANVGVRPTVGQGMRRFLEVHLLNFSGDCYGQKIAVDFIHKIRDEQRFESLDALKVQIANDVEKAKAYLV